MCSKAVEGSIVDDLGYKIKVKQRNKNISCLVKKQGNKKDSYKSRMCMGA